MLVTHRLKPDSDSFVSLLHGYNVYVKSSGRFVKQEQWERFPPSSPLTPVPSPPLSSPFSTPPFPFP